MAITKIPMSQIPAQALQVVLGNDTLDLSLYQKTTGLFCDAKVNGVVVCYGVFCVNLSKLLPSYALEVGNVFFYDTQGTGYPTYLGLGSRYILIYDESLV